MFRVLAVTATLVVAGLATASSASAQSGAIGPFNAADDGTVSAAVSATYAPVDNGLWYVAAYTLPSAAACAPDAGAPVFTSHSLTGPGTITDTVSVADKPFKLCLYLNWQTQQSLLAQSTYAPKSTKPASTKPAKTKPHVPTVTRGAAQRYLAIALNRRFSNSWSNRAGGRIQCHRLTRVRMKCTAQWAIGDSSYSGTARIWYSLNARGQAMWNYSYRIVGLDEYCAYVTHGNNCSKVYVVH
jgi:hypothetical protein